MVEVLNSLKPNNFNGNIKVIIHQLLHLDVFDCFTADDYRNALELYRFYGQSIYFSDCTILISVQKHGITKIASFDSDFDKIVGFERIF